MLYNVRLYLRSFNIFFLNKLVLKINKKFKELGFEFSSVISLPNRVEKFNILKSPHVNKKSRDQLQILIHKKFIDCFNLTEEQILKVNDFLFFSSLYWRLKILK